MILQVAPDGPAKCEGGKYPVNWAKLVLISVHVEVQKNEIACMILFGPS